MGDRLIESHPLATELCRDFARLMLVRKEGGTAPLEHPLLTNFRRARRLTRAKSIVHALQYHMARQMSVPREPVILMSFSLNERFPYLARKITEKYSACTTATRMNVWNVRRMPVKNLIKTDHIVYSRELTTPLFRMNRSIADAFSGGRRLDFGEVRGHASALERSAGKAAGLLARLFEKYKVSQYVSGFSDRYEEILNNIALRLVGAPSKEICHGVNPHNIHKSDNHVPNHADILYVWSRQYYENIKDYGGKGKIKICGYPKYDRGGMEMALNKYPKKRLITYFSQPSYDVGATTVQPLTPEFEAAERDFRRSAFDELIGLKEAEAYSLRVRYHQGEKGPGRDGERRYLMGRGVEVSENSLIQDICESDVCLGVNTSCLYEAYMFGKKVFQMDFPPGQRDTFDGIEAIRPEEIRNRVLTASSREAAYELVMDIDWFVRDGLGGVGG